MIALLTRIGLDERVKIEMAGLRGPAQREAFAYARVPRVRELPRMRWGR
jgi:hypothetical protein